MNAHSLFILLIFSMPNILIHFIFCYFPKRASCYWQPFTHLWFRFEWLECLQIRISFFHFFQVLEICCRNCILFPQFTVPQWQNTEKVLKSLKGVLMTCEFRRQHNAWCFMVWISIERSVKKCFWEFYFNCQSIDYHVSNILRKTYERSVQQIEMCFCWFSPINCHFASFRLLINNKWIIFMESNY